MTLLHRLASILRWIAGRNRAEADLDEELQGFVDMAAADQRRDGVTPAEARRLAVLQERGRGTNLFILDADGQIAEVTGFWLSNPS